MTCQARRAGEACGLSWRTAVRAASRGSAHLEELAGGVPR